jgi:multicomponent Na+:H+ antiporter subunit F
MTLIDVSLVLVALGMLAAIYRAARGPTGADRVVAAELGFIAVVCALLLVEMRIDLPAVLDITLVAVLIGFLGTIGLARLVRRDDGAGDSGAGPGTADSGAADSGTADSSEGVARE